MIRRVVIVALILGAVSCLPPLETSHYAHDKAAAIHAGMTKDDVAAQMGRPNHMYLKTTNTVVEVWSYADGYDDGAHYNAAYFRIGFDQDGRVVATEIAPRTWKNL